jgi:hypothetical protein
MKEVKCQVKPSKIKVENYIVQRRIYIWNPRRGLGQVQSQRLTA